jgi:hypothetical protein
MAIHRSLVVRNYVALTGGGVARDDPREQFNRQWFLHLRSLTPDGGTLGGWRRRRISQWSTR